MFIGRKEELALLKERYASPKTEIIAILGRRRVGKSQLIYESGKGFDGIVISYECADTGYRSNLLGLTEEIRNKFDNKYLSFSSLREVLSFLREEATKQKILFVLDEYPYMRNGKETDSEIKNAIDDINKLDNDSPLKFVLCGSAVQIMEMLADANMPLHGRFDKIIRVLPLDYLHSALFFPNASLEDKVKYHAVLGGVPYYLKQVDERKSFDENIIELFFSSSPLLTTELEKQINGEIHKIEKATYILNCLKDNLLSYTDIQQLFKSSFGNENIDYPLGKLTEMHVVEKIYIEQDNGKQKPYYQIADNALMFYYAYLCRSFANRILYTDRQYYEAFIKESLNNDFIPHMFERIGYQFIGLMNRKRLLKDVLTDLFPYVINDKVNKKNYQFDVVGQTEEGLINYECKFRNHPLSSSAIYKEQRQAELANARFIKTVFISKSPVETNVEMYGLEDLFDDRLLC